MLLLSFGMLWLSTVFDLRCYFVPLFSQEVRKLRQTESVFQISTSEFKYRREAWVILSRDFGEPNAPYWRSELTMFCLHAGLISNER